MEIIKEVRKDNPSPSNNLQAERKKLILQVKSVFNKAKIPFHSL